MGFYGNHIVPRLIHLAMRSDLLTPYRRRVLSAASGRVLEIGIGSGVNLPFYRTTVRQIIGIEPSPKLLEMTVQLAKRISMTPELIQGTAESLPLDDRSVDTVVTTWTMCSIPDIEKAVREMHRVLKPSGRLLFVEHGLCPGAARTVVAKSFHPAMEALFRRMPSQPTDCRHHSECWLPH